MSMKSTKELREFLVTQMEGVADGSIAPETSKGVANLSQQIYNTINIELKFAQARAKLDFAEVSAVRFDD